MSKQEACPLAVLMGTLLCEFTSTRGQQASSANHRKRAGDPRIHGLGQVSLLLQISNLRCIARCATSNTCIMIAT